MAWFDLDQLKLSGTLCTEIGKSDRSEMGQSGKNSVRVYVFRCAHKLGHCLTELALRVCARAQSRCAPARCAGARAEVPVPG